MKPSPRTVTFISTDQHHRARNAINPKMLSANHRIVGHKWPSALSLPNRLWAWAASLAAPCLHNTSENGCSFIFPPCWRCFEGKYTDKWELLRFFDGCWRIGCSFYFYFKCLRLHPLGFGHPHPAVAEVAGIPLWFSFAFLQCFLDRVREMFLLKKWFQCHKTIHHQSCSWMFELFCYVSFMTSSKYTSVCHRTENLDS